MNSLTQYQVGTDVDPSQQNDMMTSYIYHNEDNPQCKNIARFESFNQLFSFTAETKPKKSSVDSLSTIDSHSHNSTETITNGAYSSKKKNRKKFTSSKSTATNTNIISNANTASSVKNTCTSSGGYPGVSWNRRMGAWLSFYYDNYCRRSRTFHPKHFNMDVEAARLAAVSFIKTVEGNPRSRRAKKVDKGIKSKSPTLSSKLHHVASPTSAVGVNCNPIANTGDFTNSAPGWSPYYSFPQNKDYYNGDNYWNPVMAPDAYGVSEQLCGYNNSMVGFMFQPMGYLNYNEGYYVQNHNSNHVGNYSSQNGGDFKTHYLQYPTAPSVELGTYNPMKYSDLKSYFYSNSIKCSQPAVAVTASAAHYTKK